MSRRLGTGKLRQEYRDRLAEIRARHPHRKSDGGALLAEILTAPELADQKWAASIFGIGGYRSGLRSLERRLGELVPIVEASDEYWIGPPERKVVAELLWAIGCMDTAASHAVIARVIRTSTSHLVRADAIENTNQEHQNFEFGLVVPFLSMDASEPEISSALYALQGRDFEGSRTHVAPLLGHESDVVKAMAIYLLMRHASNLDLILPFADHPTGFVRESVAEAIRYHEPMEDEV